MIQKTKGRMALCLTLILMLLTFIWGNSILPGKVSGEISGWLQSLLGLTSTGQEGHGILRKLAHFTEFAGLGACLGWLYAMLGKKPWCSLGCAFAAACIDETIQYFVPDRGPAVADVLLDTAGGAAGIGILLLVYIICKKHNKKFGGI